MLLQSHLITGTSGIAVRPWNLPNLPNQVRVRTKLNALNVPTTLIDDASLNVDITVSSSLSPLQAHIFNWISTPSIQSSLLLSSEPERPPTKEEVKQLQNAFAAFYGAEKDTAKALELLTKAIDVWESTKQGGDEIAGLYRVRGDAHMVRK